jgi:hypothetical protein
LRLDLAAGTAARYTRYLGSRNESQPHESAQAVTAEDQPQWLNGLNTWLGAHQGACFLGILALEVVLRCSLLAGTGFPVPSYHDEFSYLLASDTYAEGRLANPPLSHPEFFETDHVLVTPTYASKYQPGQGLFLAFGQRVFGHPFFGVLLSVGLGCATLYWALLAWTPPVWAVAAGLALIGIFGLVSYWVDSYWGGGVAFLGTVLALGAWGRIRLRRQYRFGALLALGGALLLLTRPYESSLLLVALFVSAFGSAIFTGRETGPRVSRSGAFTLLAYAAPVLAAYAGFQLYLDYRVTGNPLRLPYLEYARQYDVISQLRYAALSSPKPSLNERVSEIHNVFEVSAHQQALQRNVFDDTWLLLQNSSPGLVLLTLCVALLASFRDPETRRLLALLALPALPLYFETFATPHYLAPFLGCLILLLFQSLSSLFRQAEWLGGSRYALAGICVLFGLGYLGYWKQGVLRKLSQETYAQRQRKSILEQLDKLPGNQLVFVKYSPDYSIHDEWVYNRADLAQAKVVFAHDLSTELDQSLLAEFPGRQALRLSLTPAEATLAPLGTVTLPVNPK